MGGPFSFDRGTQMHLDLVLPCMAVALLLSIASRATLRMSGNWQELQCAEPERRLCEMKYADLHYFR